MMRYILHIKFENVHHISYNHRKVKGKTMVINVCFKLLKVIIKSTLWGNNKICLNFVFLNYELFLIVYEFLLIKNIKDNS